MGLSLFSPKNQNPEGPRRIFAVQSEVYLDLLEDATHSQRIKDNYDKLLCIGGIEKKDFGLSDKFDEDMIPIKFIKGDENNEFCLYDPQSPKQQVKQYVYDLHPSLLDDPKFCKLLESYYQVSGSMHLLKYETSSPTENNPSEILFRSPCISWPVIDGARILSEKDGFEVYNLNDSLLSKYYSESQSHNQSLSNNTFSIQPIEDGCLIRLRKMDLDPYLDDGETFYPRLIYMDSLIEGNKK